MATRMGLTWRKLLMQPMQSMQRSPDMPKPTRECLHSRVSRIRDPSRLARQCSNYFEVPEPLAPPVEPEVPEPEELEPPAAPGVEEDPELGELDEPAPPAPEATRCSANCLTITRRFLP